MKIIISKKDVLNKFNQVKNLALYYEITMAILSLLTIVILIIDYFIPNYEYDFSSIDTSILIVFSLDYFIRLFFSEDKLKFIKTNVIDLISIIPFNSIFQAARFTKLLRFAKLFKILRIVAFMVKFRKNIDKFIRTNNFYYVLYLTIITIFLGALGMQFTEQKTFSDSLWWSFVTATTVGYGDISPATSMGRIIAAILMITGIGFISMLTGTISTFFINRHDENVTFEDETIQNIKNKLNDFNNLSFEDVNSICIILKSLKRKNTQ